ncbi:hypothetical protein IMCC20628_02895 [Hoeflea sp. IMCC20628]|nr:hypothetical protein IMCC20628_02895 [Hoeflea sp. IMCC20628]
MKNENHSRFRRFFSGVADSFSFARQANLLSHTSDATFRARGTTREQAIRNLMDQL